MMISKLIFVAIVAIAIVDSDGASISTDETSPQEKLERHFKVTLPDQVPISQAMDEAERWYKEEVGKKKLLGNDEELSAFLKDLIALRNMPKECLDENLEIASRMIKTVKGLNLRDKSKCVGLVANILFIYVGPLAKACQGVIYPKVAGKLSKVDPTVLDTVSQLAYDLAKFTPYHQSATRNPNPDLVLTHRFVRDLASIEYGARYGKVLLRGLKSVAAREQSVDESSVHIGAGEVHQAIERYFATPCKEYLKSADNDTFRDYLDYLRKLGKPGYGDKWPELNEFWLAQEACRKVIAEPSKLEGALMKYISLSPDQQNQLGSSESLDGPDVDLSSDDSGAMMAILANEASSDY